MHAHGSKDKRRREETRERGAAMRETWQKEGTWQRRRSSNQAAGPSRQQVPFPAYHTRTFYPVFNTSVLLPSHTARGSTPVNVASATSQMSNFTVGRRATEVRIVSREPPRPQPQQQPQSSPHTELSRPQTQQQPRSSKTPPPPTELEAWQLVHFENLVHIKGLKGVAVMSKDLKTLECIDPDTECVRDFLVKGDCNGKCGRNWSHRRLQKRNRYLTSRPLCQEICFASNMVKQKPVVFIYISPPTNAGAQSLADYEQLYKRVVNLYELKLRAAGASASMSLRPVDSVDITRCETLQAARPSWM